MKSTKEYKDNNKKETKDQIEKKSKKHSKLRESIDRFFLRIGFDRIDYFDAFADIVLIIIGSYIISFAFNVFLFPQKLSSGGVSGIANILNHFLGVPLGVMVMTLNIPLFLIAIKKIGVKFSVKTIFATLMFSVFLDMFDYTALILHVSNDLFICSMYGGVIIGIGVAILIKAGASSGGTDIIAQVIYRYTKVQRLTQVLLGIDAAVILSSMIAFNNISIGLYSIVVIFISNKVIDLIIEGESNTRVANIITKKGKEVADDIMFDLKRGVTLSDAQGAYTTEDYSMLTVILTNREISKLKKIVEYHDENAMLYILKANEAIGNGFRNF